jgi:hypothetical protein
MTGEPANTVNSGTSTRLVSMWIPGVKFGKGGRIQYENGNPNQVKFFDHRIFILCYDWFGTPQDVNIVGRVSDLISTLCFKDT